jgi:Tfp pilus assembly protein PilF
MSVIERRRRGQSWAQALGLTRAEVWGFVAHAVRLFAHGQRRKALQIVDGALVLAPHVGFFHAVAACMHGQLGHVDEALAAYGDAIRLDTKDIASRVQRAELHLRRGQLANAIDDVMAAVRLDPTARTAFGKRARALARMTSAAVHEALAKPRRHLRTTVAKSL